LRVADVFQMSGQIVDEFERGEFSLHLQTCRMRIMLDAWGVKYLCTREVPCVSSFWSRLWGCWSPAWGRAAKTFAAVNAPFAPDAYRYENGQVNGRTGLQVRPGLPEDLDAVARDLRASR
jgi:hypothetical protein